MTPKKTKTFDLKAFLNKANGDRSIATYPTNARIFEQGDAADAIFYIQKGKIKLTVVSKQGKEAVVAILGEGDFFGEGCLAGQPMRMASAAAISECTAMKLSKAAVVKLLRDEPVFAERFLTHLLTRNIKIEEDLVDQLFNSSEKRLARVLLLLANFGKDTQAGRGDSEDQPGDAGGNRGDHSLAGQLFHEPLSQARLHRLQRRTNHTQLPAERDSARLTGTGLLREVRTGACAAARERERWRRRSSAGI